MKFEQISFTASTVRAILSYIDPVGGPQIAADNDELAKPLINKLKDCLYEKNGSASVTLIFTTEDFDSGLHDQFKKVTKNISRIFKQISKD